MSGSGAYSELVAELLKWLRQNDRPEGAWFLDEGAPAPLEGMQAPSAPPAPAENAAQPQTEPQAQPQPPSQPAPAAVAAAAATPAAVEDDEALPPEEVAQGIGSHGTMVPPRVDGQFPRAAARARPRYRPT